MHILQRKIEWTGQWWLKGSCRVESISIGLYQEQRTDERVSSCYSSPSQVVSACLQGGTGIRRWYGRRYRYESIWGWQNHPQTGILGRTCSNTTGRAGFWVTSQREEKTGLDRKLNQLAHNLQKQQVENTHKHSLEKVGQFVCIQVGCIRCWLIVTFYFLITDSTSHASPVCLILLYNKWYKRWREAWWTCEERE